MFFLKLLRKKAINSSYNKPEENKFSGKMAIASVFAQFLQKTEGTTVAVPSVLRKTFSFRMS